jgi:two-component system nitrogen regulation sensor histidine kinase NtrY
MVDEFSAFARMPQPRMADENLSSIIRDSLILQQGAHPEIRYDVTLPPSGPMVSCDRRQIGQTLTNLLQNAADAIAMTGRSVNTDEKSGQILPVGVISVAVSELDDRVRITISDDGVGLPQEDRDRLTEPYVTHKPKGTGLGLAIVKKIMEDHEGTVELRDRPDGAGTEATLILPLKAGAQKEYHGV